MKSARQLTASLLLLATASIVSGCGGAGQIRPVFPSAVDLTVEQKPEITPEVLESDVAAAEYDSAVEAWGERGWATVGRLCRYFQTHNMKIDCPKEP